MAALVPRIELDIRPEPSPRERRVLVAALAELAEARPVAYESEWRRSGIGAADGSWEAPRSRIKPGATRA